MGDMADIDPDSSFRLNGESDEFLDVKVDEARAESTMRSRFDFSRSIAESSDTNTDFKVKGEAPMMGDIPHLAAVGALSAKDCNAALSDKEVQPELVDTNTNSAGEMPVTGGAPQYSTIDGKAEEPQLMEANPDLSEASKHEEAEPSLPPEEDPEEHECRVCRGEAEPDRPLFFPCHCSGSIKYVHEDCLADWLKVSKQTHCEVCKHPLTFSPIYAEGVPDRLPWWMVWAGILREASRHMPAILSNATLLFFYLLLFPLCSAIAFNIAVSRHKQDLEGSFNEFSTRATFILELCKGNLINGAILLTSIGLTQVKAYIVELIEDFKKQHPLEEEGDERAEHQRGGVAVQEAEENREVVERHEDEERLPVREEPAPLLLGAQDGEIPLLLEAGGDWQRRQDELLQLLGPVVLILEDLRDANQARDLHAILYSAGAYMCCNIAVVLCTLWAPYQLALLVLHFRQKASLSEKIQYAEDVYGRALADVYIMLLGYIICTCLSAIALVAALAVASHRSVRVKRWLAQATHRITTGFHWGVKISIMIGFEMAVEPFFFGWLLDLATRDLLQASWGEYFHLLQVVPGMNAFIHWLYGLMTIVLVNMILLELRKILHPNVLKGLLPRDNIDENALWQLLDQPVVRLVRNNVFLGLLHVGIIAILVYLPIQLAIYLLPNLAPLQMYINHPLSEMHNPLDILLFHFTLPFIFIKLEPRKSINRLLVTLLRGWSKLFKLDQILFESATTDQPVQRRENTAPLPPVPRPAEAVALDRDAPQAVAAAGEAPEAVAAAGKAPEAAASGETPNVPAAPGGSEVGARTGELQPDAPPASEPLSEELIKEPEVVADGPMTESEALICSLAPGNCAEGKEEKDEEVAKVDQCSGVATECSAAVDVVSPTPMANHEKESLERLSLSGGATGGTQLKFVASEAPATDAAPGSIAEMVAPTAEDVKDSQTSSDESTVFNESVGKTAEAAVKAAEIEKSQVELATEGKVSPTQPEETMVEDSGASAEANNEARSTSRQGSKSLLAIRLTAFVALCISSIIGVSLLVLLAPLLLGRQLFSFLDTPLGRNDFYDFVIGFILLTGAVKSCFLLSTSIKLQVQNAVATATSIAKHSVRVSQICALATLWYGVVALLAGLAFDLAVLGPCRVSLGQMAGISFGHDWIAGMILVRVWSALAVAGAFGRNYPWKAKLERLERANLQNFDAKWTFLEVVSPALVALLDFLAYPFVFAAGIMPLLTSSMQWYNAGLRYSFLAHGALHLLRIVTRLTVQWYHSFSNKIRDEHYMVGRRLLNVNETPSPQADVATQTEEANAPGPRQLQPPVLPVAEQVPM